MYSIVDTALHSQWNGFGTRPMDRDGATLRNVPLDDFLCIGHRGAAGHAPENSLRSVRKAVELGADVVEVDVHYVQGELVVIHDRRLERLAGAAGRVGEQTLDYLRSLDTGGGERIATLAEVIACLGDTVGLNVELKGPKTGEPVVNLLQQYFADGRLSPERVLVSSFNHHELYKVHTLDARLRIGALVVGVPLSYAAFATELNAWSVHVSLDFVDADMIADAHARGLHVYAFTVNAEDDIAEVHAMGADGVFTDYPDRVVAYRQKLHQARMATMPFPQEALRNPAY